MSVSAPSRASRGRPRDPACDEAILAATLELLAEAGYYQTTVDAIAARAGVSKPTIYRRWPDGKEQLVSAAVAECRERLSEPIDTGSLRGDLAALLKQHIVGMREHAHLAAGLSQRLRESPDLARVFREQIVGWERERFTSLLRRAIDRGELPGIPASATLLADLVGAAVHQRALITGEPLDGKFVGQMVDQVLLPALQATR